MLREILRYAMRQRADVEIVEAGSGANLAATAERTSPDVVAVGRPDSDTISARTVLAVAPSASFVELSADGRSAVVYRADSAPRTFEGLGAGSLLDLILSNAPSERRGALR
jgi:DNA-binding NarL/FixJ family response regulator